MFTLIMTVSVMPAVLLTTPLGNNTSRVNNASIKTLTLCYKPNPFGAVCIWSRMNNPARWTDDVRRWYRIVVIWTTSTYKHRLVCKQSWTVLAKLFLHLTPYTCIDYWIIDDRGPSIDMVVLYYGPKRLFLLPFSQMLTDLGEICQDLLLISWISIFCYFASESMSKLGQYLSKLWTISK